MLNVGTAVDQCQQELNLDISFIVLGELYDISHTGIYGLAENAVKGARALAKSVNPSEVYPAIP